MQRLLVPGSMLDRYELVRLVGAGGMGHAWQARMHGAFGFYKEVAIKVMVPDVAGDEHHRKMFLDEARIAGRLTHPNVAQVLDVGEADGLLFQVIEWVDGPSFEGLLRDAAARREPLPLGVVLRIIADAAAGLHAAHELLDEAGASLGVIHRDVSPHNVLVGASGIAKVIDFGIARSNVRQATATKTGFARGKPNYLPPEQALGFEVDRRADVWGLGASLYRALSGRAPFDTVESLVAHVYRGAPIAPLPPDVPDYARAIVERAIAIEPRHRFPTADGVREAAESAIAAAGLAVTSARVAGVILSSPGATAQTPVGSPDTSTRSDETHDEERKPDTRG